MSVSSSSLAGNRFRHESGLTSRAVGPRRPLPVVGTGTSVTLTVGQTAVFMASAVTFHVLTVAELQGLHVADAERRRTWSCPPSWVRRAATRGPGELGLSTLFWAAQLLTQMPVPRSAPSTSS